MSKNRIWSFVFLMCFLLTGCGSGAAPQATAEDAKTHSHPSEEELTAMYAANALMQVWQEDQMACFGGAYRDGEQVIVLLTKDREEYRDEILKRTSFDELILFETCEFSMNDLNTLYDKVDAFAADRDSEDVWYHIAVSENCVRIHLLEVTEEIAAEWKALDTAGGGRAIQVSLRELETPEK